MGTLLVERVVAVISFSMVFTELEMFLAQGPAFFIVVVFTLFCAVVLTLFRIGIFVRYWFCAATHVGVGSSIIFLPFVLMKQNGRYVTNICNPHVPVPGEEDVLRYGRGVSLFQLCCCNG